MEDKIFDIAFQHDGREYKGWVNPSDKLNESGNPSSYHVVLNNVSFGYLSFDNCEWAINEDRPEAMIDAVGKEIEKYYKL